MTLVVCDALLCLDEVDVAATGLVVAVAVAAAAAAAVLDEPCDSYKCILGNSVSASR